MRSGGFAELVCAGLVFFHGYRILKRNYALRGGEVDIIASCEDLLVFLEVRLRSNVAFG